VDDSILETIMFQQRLARLQSLLEASRRVHASIELDEILPEVLTILVKELEIPGAAIVPADESPQIRRYTYGRIPEDFSSKGSHGASQVSYPLLAGDGRKLALVALLMQEGRELDAEEENFVEGLTLQASLAVDNALSHQQRLQMERLQQDLNTAREIQRSFLPQSMPEIPGYAVAARNESCYEVGGDYLDIFRAPDGRYVLVVADVAGKGLSSALVGSSFRARLRAMFQAGMPLDQIAVRMNILHYEEGEAARRKYMTAILAALDPEANRLEYVNAGHNHGLLTDGGGRRLLKSSGTPLGMLPIGMYRSEAVEMAPGSVVVFYTDGITEASRAQEEYGLERLAGLVESRPEDAPEDLLRGVWESVEGFEDGTGPSDDKTALVLKRRKF